MGEIKEFLVFCSPFFVGLEPGANLEQISFTSSYSLYIFKLYVYKKSSAKTPAFLVATDYFFIMFGSERMLTFIME